MTTMGLGGGPAALTAEALTAAGLATAGLGDVLRAVALADGVAALIGFFTIMTFEIAPADRKIVSLWASVDERSARDRREGCTGWDLGPFLDSPPPPRA